MFERTGFIHLAMLKGMLTIESLPQEERELLILREKKREAESMVHAERSANERHIDEDWFEKEVEALIPRVRTH